MPELPEMETYKRLLNPRLVGKVISETEVHREKSINLPVSRFQAVLNGNVITSIERRAKFLLFHLADGHSLVLHLMLGGWMFLGTDKQKPERTVQVEWNMEGIKLFFLGLRLGYIHYKTQDETAIVMGELGPEPLELSFTFETLQQLLGGSRSRLKTLLTDQKKLAGIGNCYVDEICFAAGILPDRIAADMERTEMFSLYGAMRTVLKEAIQAGGYMDHPLYVGDTLTGGFDRRCRVYDREGEACERCGKPIQRMADISGRKAFSCSYCQR